jgi:6,7-dimethyl-8-ribityllumazine synthase
MKVDSVPSVDLGRYDVARVEPDGGARPRIAVVAARFNAAIVDRLVDGALARLAERGLGADRIVLVRVPGAWELPVAAMELARSERVDGIVALGCVIRGDTDHYDVIVRESARGLGAVALETGVPVANGVLTCEQEAQALARAGGAEGNKGVDAADAALEMAALVPRLVRVGH